MCVTAVNAGAGSDTSLSCWTVVVPGGPPVGHVDEVTAVPGGVQVRGWAVDPDTSASTYVWVGVSGGGGPALASSLRPDVGAAFPGYGDHHGFEAFFASASGPQRVCVTAVNAAAGRDTPLACRTVTVPTPL